MIRSLGAVILAAILTLEAGGAAHADWWDDAKEWLNPTQEVVAIDAWWTIDFGKNSCAYNERLRNTGSWSADVFGDCLGHEDGGASLFVRDLTGQAAVTPLCKGLTFVVYGGPKVENSPVNASATYTLIPDYTPGQKQQTWDLSGSKGHSLSVRGEGTAREIIRDVCNAIKGRGAKVIQ